MVVEVGYVLVGVYILDVGAGMAGAPGLAAG